jgi:hypothetical protein
MAEQKMIDEVTLLRQAVKEALLYFEAPPGHPRHWAVSRANLCQLLQRAYNYRQYRIPPHEDYE